MFKLWGIKRIHKNSSKNCSEVKQSVCDNEATNKSEEQEGLPDSEEEQDIGYQ